MVTDLTASQPGQMPPTVQMMAGDVRTITIDIAGLLATHQLAYAAQCDGATARTRFGNTVEVTISPKAGVTQYTASVRTTQGGRDGVLTVPFVVIAK